MTMHLEGPWLSMQGKKKGKKKFASAEAKRRAEQLEQEWQKILDSHKPKKVVAKKVTVATPTVYRRVVEKPKSLGEWVTGAVNSKPTMQYTGTKMKGIGTLHKSNAVPVFTDEEAISLASMRR
jgi:N-acetylglucosamine-6-phosphate deacetylase